MTDQTQDKPTSSGATESQQSPGGDEVKPGGDEVKTADKHFGAAAFQAKYAFRDTAAGIITGTMAIPLSIGIAMMSD